MGFFGGLFGGGGLSGGGFGGGIRGKDPFEREVERQTRRAVEKVADSISPTLGKVVKIVNGVQEVKDDLIFGKQPPFPKSIFGNGDEKKLNKSLTPAYGAVVYCELGFGSMEHSGIYIGGNQIVDLDGNGRIKKVSLREFTGHITTFNTEIWIPCDSDGRPIGLSYAANRAIEMLGEKRNYNLILDNCHQFSSGCITGDFDNADNFLWMLKDTFQKEYGDNVVWKQWKWY